MSSQSLLTSKSLRAGWRQGDENGGRRELPRGPPHEGGGVASVRLGSPDAEAEAADVVVTTTFKQFQDVVQRKMRRIANKEKDISLPEAFSPESDEDWACVLDTLGVLAKHQASQLAQLLLTWWERLAAKEPGVMPLAAGLGSGTASKRKLAGMLVAVASERKLLSGDFAYCQAMLRVLESLRSDNSLSPVLRTRLLDTALNRLETLSLNPIYAADPPPILLLNRKRLMDLHTQVVAQLAHDSFQVTTTAVLDRVARLAKGGRAKEAAAASMCRAVRGVPLPIASPDEVTATVAFLSALQALIKSARSVSLGNSALETLGYVLQGWLELPPGATKPQQLPPTAVLVLELKMTALSLTKKTKNALFAYPLVASTLAVSEKETFHHEWWPVCEQLLRIVPRDAATGAMVVACIGRLLKVYLLEYRDPVKEQVNPRLLKIVHTLFAFKRKSMLPPYKDNLDALVSLVELIAAAKLDFAMQTIVIPLLQDPEGDPHRTIAGLQAFKAINDRLTNMAATPAATASPAPDASSSSSSSSSSSPDRQRPASSSSAPGDGSPVRHERSSRLLKPGTTRGARQVAANRRISGFAVPQEPVATNIPAGRTAASALQAYEVEVAKCHGDTFAIALVQVGNLLRDGAAALPGPTGTGVAAMKGVPASAAPGAAAAAAAAATPTTASKDEDEKGESAAAEATIAELAGKNKNLLVGLAVLKACLALVPRLRPMPDVLVPTLTALCFHLDRGVADHAYAALQRVVDGWKPVRVLCLTHMTANVVGLSRRQRHSLVLNAVGKLTALVSQWAALCRSERQTPAASTAGGESATSRLAALFRPAEVEALALSLLLSVRSPFRVAALNLLRQVRDLSSELARAPGAPDPGIRVADVIDGSGPTLLAQVDVELTSSTRPLVTPAGASFLVDDVARSTTTADELRWCLFMAAVGRTLLDVAPAVARASWPLVGALLGELPLKPYIQPAAAATSVDKTTSHRAVDQWRVLATYLAATCDREPARPGPEGKKKVGTLRGLFGGTAKSKQAPNVGVRDARELFSLVMPYFQSDWPQQQYAAVVVFSQCHPTQYGALFEELAPVATDCHQEVAVAAKRVKAGAAGVEMSRQSVKRHVQWSLLLLTYRLLVVAMAPGVLARNHLLAEAVALNIEQAYAYLSSPSYEYRCDQEFNAMRFHLAGLIRDAANHLGGTGAGGAVFKTGVRERVWSYLAIWIDMEAGDDDQGSRKARKAAERAYVDSLLKRVSLSPDLAVEERQKQLTTLTNTLTRSAQSLSWVCHHAMAAVLQGSAFSDAVFHPSWSRVLPWMDMLLSSSDRADRLVGQRAVLHYLQSNPRRAMPVVVDRCYAPDSLLLAEGHLLALVALCTSDDVSTVQLLSENRAVLVNLVLFHLGAPSHASRRAAVALFDALRPHLIGPTDPFPFPYAVTSAVPETYRRSQRSLSGRLAQAAPSLTHAILREVAARAGGVREVQLSAMLHYLEPWLGNLHPDTWEQIVAGKGGGEGLAPLDQVLSDLFTLTITHGAHHFATCGALWQAVAASGGDPVDGTAARAVLRFLLFRHPTGILTGGPRVLQTAKEVVLHVTHAAPEATISTLVAELASPPHSLVEKAPPTTPRRPRTTPKDYERAEVHDLACMLLVEVLHGHQEVIVFHLPRLLHYATLGLDHTNSAVLLHRKLLLANVLLSHAATRLTGDGDLAELLRLQDLCAEVLAGEGQRPLWAATADGVVAVQLAAHTRGQTDAPAGVWTGSAAQAVDAGAETSLHHEGISLAGLVSEVVELMAAGAGGNLREDWATEALAWATQSPSVHDARRSYQVFRALHAPADDGGDGTWLPVLIASLQACLAQAGTSYAQLALETIETIETICKGSKTASPAVFWTSAGLLLASEPPLFRAALPLMAAVLDSLDLTSSAVAELLRSQAPADALVHLPHRPWTGLLEPTLRGLRYHMSSTVTTSLLALYSTLPAEFLWSVQNERPTGARLAGNIAGLLPYLVFQVLGLQTGSLTAISPEAAMLAENLAQIATGSVGPVSSVAKVLTRYREGHYAAVDPFLTDLAHPFASAFFPAYDWLVYGTLFPMLKDGEPQLRPAVVAVLVALLLARGDQPMSAEFVAGSGPCLAAAHYVVRHDLEFRPQALRLIDLAVRAIQRSTRTGGMVVEPKMKKMGQAWERDDSMFHFDEAQETRLVLDSVVTHLESLEEGIPLLPLLYDPDHSPEVDLTLPPLSSSQPVSIAARSTDRRLVVEEDEEDLEVSLLAENPPPLLRKESSSMVISDGNRILGDLPPISDDNVADLELDLHSLMAETRNPNRLSTSSAGRALQRGASAGPGDFEFSDSEREDEDEDDTPHAGSMTYDDAVVNLLHPSSPSGTAPTPAPRQHHPAAAPPSGPSSVSSAAQLSLTAGSDLASLAAVRRFVHLASQPLPQGVGHWAPGTPLPGEVFDIFTVGSTLVQTLTGKFQEALGPLRASVRSQEVASVLETERGMMESSLVGNGPEFAFPPLRPGSAELGQVAGAAEELVGEDGEWWLAFLSDREAAVQEVVGAASSYVAAIERTAIVLAGVEGGGEEMEGELLVAILEQHRSLVEVARAVLELVFVAAPLLDRPKEPIEEWLSFYLGMEEKDTELLETLGDAGQTY